MAIIKYMKLRKCAGIKMWSILHANLENRLVLHQENSKKNKLFKKARLNSRAFSVSINLSTRWQTRKKEGKFVEHGLVGVCGYGRGRVRRKQAETATNCGL